MKSRGRTKPAASSARWREKERRSVLSLVMAVPKAIDSKDKDAVLRVYDTYDPLFCTFEDTPDRQDRVDGVQFRKFIEGLGNLESSSIDRKDVRVDLITRNVAVVSGMDDWESRQDGKEIKGVSRFTIVFRKKKGEWKAIHEHFTKIA